MKRPGRASVGFRCRHAVHCVVLLVALGCGNLDSETPSPLATLEGRVTNAAQVAIKGQMRLALLWVNPALKVEETTVDGDVVTTASGAYKVAQDVPMATSFPATFSMQLNGPPPAQVMFGKEADLDDTQNWPTGAKIGLATPIVYQDDNGNGKLDLLDENSKQLIDTVLGADQQLGLVYFEGQVVPLPFPPDSTVGKPKLGYNVLKVPECVFEKGKLGAPPCNEKVTWYAPTQPIELALSLDPRLNRLLCTNPGAGTGTGSVGVSKDMGPAKPPYPSSSEVSCDDSFSYRIDNCSTTQDGLCGPTETNCVAEVWHMPDPDNRPADWPCAAGLPPGGA